MNRYHKLLLSSIAGISGMVSASAQVPVAQMLQQVKGFNKERLCYNYQVDLWEVPTGKPVDHMEGRMYMYRTDYLDSNAHYINVKDKDYAVQINQEQQTAYVQSVKQLRSRTKKDPAAQTSVLFDLNRMLEKHIAKISSDKDREGNLVVNIRFDRTDLAGLTAVIDPSNTVLRMTLDFGVETDLTGSYRRTLSLYDISETFDQRLVQTSRFINYKGKGIQMKAPYNAYPVKQIIATNKHF